MKPKPVHILSVIALLVLYLTATAFAAVDPPPPDVDAASWIKAIYTAVTSKNWGLVVGLALIGVVFPARKYGPAIFKSKGGGLILAFAISLAGTFGAALLAGARPDLVMVVTALTTAATAAGGWAWLKDHLTGVQAANDKIVAEAPAPPLKFGSGGSLLGMAIVLLVCTQSSCVASTRQTALNTVDIGMRAAGAALVEYDRAHQMEIAEAAATASAAATTREAGQAAIADGRAKLATYNAKQAVARKALIALYGAIAIATTLNDDVSLQSAQDALAIFVRAVVALTGGGK